MKSGKPQQVTGENNGHFACVLKLDSLHMTAHI